MKRHYILILPALFLYLLLFPAASLSSAREGLLLWYSSVVPVLFPFMLLCRVAIRLRLLDPLLAVLYPPLRLLFGCSPYGAFAITSGFLCGFPMGAKVTADLAEEGLISREESRFLYGFVNNLSPAFILSFLALDQMKLPRLRYVFLSVILGSSLLYGLLTSLAFRKKEGQKPSPGFSEKGQKPAGPEKFSFALLDECISDATQNTLRLGAYIMLFSILTGAASLLLPQTHPAALAVTASLEVTNGIRLLCAGPLSPGLRFLLVNGAATFGGFSALAQTVGIASMDRELVKYYTKSRVLCTLLSILLSLGALAALRFLSILP